MELEQTKGFRIKFEDLPAPCQYNTKSHLVDDDQYSIYQRWEVKTEQKSSSGTISSHRIEVKVWL